MNRRSPHGQWRRILSGLRESGRLAGRGALMRRGRRNFPGASAGGHRARAMMAAPLAQRKAFGHQEAPAVAAATEAQLVAARLAHVGTVQLADAVVRQTGPGADGLGARLVPQEAQRQLHARSLAAVAIVADAHGSRPAALRVATLWERFSKTQPANLVKNYQIHGWLRGPAPLR